MDKIRTAILVDSGFYRKRAKSLWGEKTPKERADDLFEHIDGLQSFNNPSRLNKESKRGDSQETVTA